MHIALNRYLAVKGDLNPANALIIYAWNEHDEGGWLMPTLGVDGRANEERMKAVRSVLRANAALTPPKESP